MRTNQEGTRQAKTTFTTLARACKDVLASDTQSEECNHHDCDHYHHDYHDEYDLDCNDDYHDDDDDNLSSGLHLFSRGLQASLVQCHASFKISIDS